VIATLGSRNMLGVAATLALDSVGAAGATIGTGGGGGGCGSAGRGTGRALRFGSMATPRMVF
jgi:hypothetical protein